MARISTVNYQDFIDKHSGDMGNPSITFARIKEIRQELRLNYLYSDFESAGGITEAELKEFASTVGYSGSDYTDLKKAIDSVGNGILFFTYAYGPDYMIWAYIEKE